MRVHVLISSQPYKFNLINKVYILKIVHNFRIITCWAMVHFSISRGHVLNMIFNLFKKQNIKNWIAVLEVARIKLTAAIAALTSLT